MTNLSSGFGLSSLLRVVSGDTLGLDTFSIGVFLVVRAEQINLIIVLFIFGSSSSRANEGIAGPARTGKSIELGCVGLDVLVPAGHADERGIRLRSDGLEDSDIGLRGSVSGERRVKVSLFVRCMIFRRTKEIVNIR